MQIAVTRFLMKLGTLQLRIEFALEDAPFWDGGRAAKNGNGALVAPASTNGENVPL